jgi:hypothetical protein
VELYNPASRTYTDTIPYFLTGPVPHRSVNMASIWSLLSSPRPHEWNWRSLSA